jgi:zinc transport system substrate-binding protein
MINTSDSFNNKYIALAEGMTHSHGPEGEHVHKGFAFTTWLDFKLAQQQAAAIKTALIRNLPEYKSIFDANLDKLNSDLKQLDDYMKIIGAGYAARPLFGSHPVYQYLAAGYKLPLLSVHWEPGEMPAEKDWEIFKNKLKKHPGKVMLWEDQPLAEIENRLKELGVASVVFSPCANMPDKGDFYEVMKKNINNFK